MIRNIVKTENRKRKATTAFLSFYVFCFLFSVFLSPSALAIQEATPSVKAATDSAADKSTVQSVRDKVRQTIENLVRKPKAVVGNLTQVTDSTIAIKNKNGKSAMVATTVDTSYFKVVNDKKTEIKFQDLAIGDFTVALGYKNGNDILDAKRVITFDKEPVSNRQAVYGTVQTNAKGVLTIKNPQTGETWTIQTTSKTKITTIDGGAMKDIKITDINEGDRVVAAGVLDDKKDKTLKADRVHVPGKTGVTNPSTSPKASPSPSPKTSPKLSPKPSPTP